MSDTEAFWTEENSEHFIALGQIYTPSREEIGETVLDLFPAREDEAFLAVDLGIGGGWLSDMILERFPRSRMLGLDGSPTMLHEARVALDRFAGRFELRHFQLDAPLPLTPSDTPVRAIVSSLVIHHLDGPSKKSLYGEIYRTLEPGGALLVVDVVAPNSERERRHMARAWDAVVKRQSLALRGDLDAYERFVEEQWNWYRYPDPGDMPSTLPEHLGWLNEAGFTGVNVFWERAGHAVYGGYKRL